MPAWLGQMAGQIGGQAAGTAMGIAAQRIGKSYDRKQWIKDFEVQAPRQMELERRMMEMQQQNQMEMWHDTNYGAQMKEIKNAGLNPAMMYGMSGGGGTTTGSSGGGAPQVKGTSTGTGSGGGGGAIGMNLLTASQVKLMEAQARKLNVDADKAAGVDTENVKADTGQKLANTGNVQADTVLKKVETNIANLELAIKNDTQGDVMDRIRWEAKRAYESMEQLRWDNALSKEQFDDKVNMLKTELAGAALRNLLTKAGTENVKADTKNKGAQNNLIQAETQSEIAKRLQGWRNLSYEEQKLELHKYLTERGIDQNEQKMIIGTVMDVFNLGTKHKEDKNYSEYESGQTYDDGSYERKRTRRY